METTMPLIFSIDGNIGSGKSRLVDDLQKFYINRDDIYFVPEPVDEWQSVVDKDGTPILTNLYKNPKEYAFRFQMMAYISRLDLLKKAIKNNKYKVIITERSTLTDKHVFEKMLYDDGKIEEDEHTIYNKWFYSFLDDINVSGLIYVRATPSVCSERVQKRNREGETISLSYLENCHTYHENWINDETCTKHVIDADIDLDLDKNSDMRNTWLHGVDDFIVNECNKLSSLTPSLLESSSDKYILYFDGGCRNNPSDSCGAGAVIYKNDVEVWKDYKLYEMSNATNNIAEYYGLIIGLQGAINMKIKNIVVKGDSQLVINQIIGKYKVNAVHLQKLYSEANDLLQNFNNVVFEYVKRDKNKRADELANIAMDAHAHTN